MSLMSLKLITLAIQLIFSLHSSSLCNSYLIHSKPKQKFNNFSVKQMIESDENFLDLFSDSIEEVENPKVILTTGMIPPYLQGSLIRNGPAVFGSMSANRDTGRRYTHLFDGLARLTRYEFQPEKNAVKFSAKFLKSQWWKKIVKEKGDIPPSITTGPVTPPFNDYQKIQAVLTSSTLFDNVPVNVVQLGGSKGPWVGVTDAPVLLEFDVNSLETRGRVQAKNSITSFGGIEIFSTAHPINQGSFTYNYFLELRPLPVPGMPTSNLAHIVRTNSNLEREVVGTVELGENVVPYVHDFSLSEKYAVLCIWPLRMDAAKNLNCAGFLPQLEWFGDKGINTKIYVFDKSSKSESKRPIVEFEAPPLFAYHHINSYIESKSDESTGISQKMIVVDIAGYDTPGIVNGKHGFAYIENMRDPELRRLEERDAQCYRFRIPLPSTTEASETSVPPLGGGGSKQEQKKAPAFIEPILLPMMDERGFFYGGELARVDDARKGSFCRFSYAFTGFAGTDADRGGFTRWAVVKRDHLKAERLAEQLKRLNVDFKHLKHSGSLDLDSLRASEPLESSAVIWEEPGCFPSEPIFVRDPAAGAAEDQGVLLSQTYDTARRETFLLVLDAVTMKEVARFYTGIRCPVSFHGQYVP